MVINDRETVDLKTLRGTMRTHLFFPVSPGRYPGILFYSEIFQVTGPIRRAAAFLAGHGFMVAVPEIYHELEPAGTILPYDESGTAIGNAHKTSKEVESYDADARAVLDFLLQDPRCTGKLGAMGICIGGHLAFRAAMNSDVLATACFYATDIHTHGLGKGLTDNTLSRIPEINGELLMIWGRQDPHIPRDGRAIVYNALADANKIFTWHEFNGAHAFMRDEGARYDPSLAQLCYTLTLELFKRILTRNS